jgi:integrase
MKLTAASIAALTCPAGKKDITFFDDALPGFGLRCRATGVRRYVVQFETGGRTRRVTLGSPEVLGFDQARKAARTILARKALGLDPALEKAEARQAARQTLGCLVETYLADRRTRVRPTTMRELTRYLTRWWQPLHGLPISKVARADIAAHLNGPPVAAGQARAALMGFYGWCIKQGLADTNPVIGTAVPDEHVKPRERVLSAAELVAIWNACDGPFAYDTIVRLLICTAARRQEVGSMAHAELDRATGLWTISGDRAKSGRDHVLPLSPMARELIDDWLRRGAWPERLFSPKGYTAWAVGKARLDARCGVEQWRVHDIRRSVATHMGDMGITPHVIEAVLGHQTGSKVARTYNKAAYVNDMRLALVMWSDHLQSLIAGTERKIVPMRG